MSLTLRKEEFVFAAEIGANQLIPVTGGTVLRHAIRQFLELQARRLDSGIGIDKDFGRYARRPKGTHGMHLCHDPLCQRDRKRKLGIKPGPKRKPVAQPSLEEQLADPYLGRQQRKDIKRRAKQAAEGARSSGDPAGATPGGGGRK